MFHIGDKIVYPRHGAGVIENIEEKEVLNEKCKYYVLRVTLGDMRVMIPIEGSQSAGIRKTIDKEQAEEIFSILSSEATTMCKNWSQRYRDNESRIRQGDIFEIAGIVKNLTIMDRAKKLSTGEKRMLQNARQLLISELMLVLDETQEKVEEITDKMIK